ncbi:dTDP-4-dehydrorhamnose reductase [Chitinophaga costaii]|uniref:dTDP-4-dehydrorhamnose reductase n=1 Tax=Chitinophaga costaii TaxID=1335309 RepID=A0A1C4A040_9BACT|nr:dTDP-4-dehydrorhamnose reductase [Chitinophaga costaii]PUZ30579.1 dTDP-4-dehydrorhamnose reductase [Chitinophaga costaii]SCB87943.1 dTDP-4-dehydrorhamnose reductase [Chitinophaga costaii]
MKNILITGASGQLGQAFKSIATQYPDFAFLFTDREELDITQADAVNAYFEQHQVDALINCAAYTAVDKAESEEELAFKLNFEAVLYLAQASFAHKATFIQLSTDYVFDGKHYRPYTENDEPNPSSMYGASKLRGEAAAQGENPDAIILRTSWLYSEFGQNFAKRMKELMAERTELNIVFDQTGTPTYAVDLAGVTLKMLGHKFEYPEAQLAGVYHYSNEGVTSWYDFAVAIKQLTGSSCELLPITTDQYPTPAERPAYSVFNKNKIKETLGIAIPYWTDSLKVCLSKL